MLIQRLNSGIRVIKTDDDKKIYKETEFWHKLKTYLNDWHGHDLIKKLMYKDGHLVDDHQYYLRDRDWGYCIYDNHYAVRFVHEAFNEGSVDLVVHILSLDNIHVDSRKEKQDVEAD